MSVDTRWEVCPVCGRALALARRDFGMLWLCDECVAAFVTLPVLRRLAPSLAEELRSMPAPVEEGPRLACPFCAGRLLQRSLMAFGPERRLLACPRCRAVRLDRSALRSILVRARTEQSEALKRSEAQSKLALLQLIRSLERA